MLNRIKRHLIINTSFLSDLGLFHGKMGIALFFAHYYKYTNNNLYNNFIYELMEEVYTEINNELPIGLESGLSGIGWGLAYLLQNKFVEGNPDEILYEIDKKIMEKDVRRMTDKSLRTGLNGIFCYVYKRLYMLSGSSNIPFDATYLDDLEFATNDFILPNDQEILDYIISIPTGKDILSWKLGLENGCAGYALKTII
jgi:hypothetical protein